MLGQAGVSEISVIDCKGIAQGHRIVIIHQEYVNTAVGTAVGIARASDQDCVLAVDLLGIHDGGDVTAGACRHAGGNDRSVPYIVFAIPDCVRIGDCVLAAADKQTQGAVV